MPTLAQILDSFDPAAGFDMPGSWRQGRTAFGGLSAALALQTALRTASSALPPLKSAHIGFIGPADGTLRFAAQVLRHGKSATSVAVDCLADNQVALRAALLFAQPRPSRIVHNFLSARPAVVGPNEAKPITDSVVTPAFVVNFDMRLAGGALPVSAATDPQLLVWARHRDASGVDPSVALVALGDCLPPAAMTCFTEPAPVSSMTWSLDFPQPASTGDWFLLRSVSRHAEDGYSLQDMQIWDTAGRLVLWGRQTVALYA
ncbi:acyl-CoA thioesterase II [Xanthomonas euvesicatoria]|uniref:acyl-CoA thioesterase n=1 Tax=Xanthomonas euvesicatoria TaxID=456327 RepID=UPI001C462DF8|nr:thioesterase family protein [Xanthomonas euvesicatoria]MBV6842713.1 thioesterase family protein [Xanthomonas campestris pv. fici]